MDKLVFATSIVSTLAAGIGLAVDFDVNSKFASGLEVASPLFEHAAPEQQTVSFYGQDVAPDLAALFETASDGRDELEIAEAVDDPPNTSVLPGGSDPYKNYCSTNYVWSDPDCSAGSFGPGYQCSTSSLFREEAYEHCSSLAFAPSERIAFCSAGPHSSQEIRCSVLHALGGSPKCSTHYHACSAAGDENCSVYAYAEDAGCSVLSGTPSDSTASCSTYDSTAYCSVDGDLYVSGSCTVFATGTDATCSAFEGLGQCSTVTSEGVTPPGEDGMCHGGVR